MNSFISDMNSIDPVPSEEWTGLPDEGFVTERIVDNELFNVIEQQMKQCISKFKLYFKFVF